MKHTLALLASVAALGVSAQQKPHVILIMTDQQRFDYLGSVSPWVITPHLDALADDGVRFTQAYSSTPSSTPARAALLTGQSPWHHGLIGYNSKIAEEYPIEMPRLMAEAGYYTYGIGKMHWHPQRSLRGFVATELDESGRVEDPGFISDYRQWFAQAAPGLNPDSTRIGWNAHAAAPYALEEHLHPTRWTGDRAVNLIESYTEEKPLFLKVSFARPHSPYDPPQRLLDMYRNVGIPGPAVGDWAAEFADYPDTPDAAFHDYGPEYAANSRRHYAAAVTFIDEEIGRIVAALKEKGMYDNSLILFVSDHGDMLGDHHHWRKTYPFEGSSHVPFIVRYPFGMEAKADRGSWLDYLVEIRDILPTFLDAAGAPIPAGVDGRSVLQPIREPRLTLWRQVLDLEHRAIYRPDCGWVALTTGRYKYVWYYSFGKEMLFDLTYDPYESTSLDQDPDHQGLVETFRVLMAEHLTERGEQWVKDGQLQVIKNVPVFTPNFPGN